MMTLLINGETRSLLRAAHIAELIRFLGIKPDRIAIELNRRIVKKTEWGTTRLQDGDRIEIVQFVGGG